MMPGLHFAPRDALQLADLTDRPPSIQDAETIEAENLAAAILIGSQDQGGDRAWGSLSMARLQAWEESMLLTYALQEERDARRVVDCAVQCGIRAPVARFALAKLLQPSRFAAGVFREHRPKGRRADINHEVRAAEMLYRQWLRDAALAFLLVYAIESRPSMSGEIQNPGIRQSEIENESITFTALKES